MKAQGVSLTNTACQNAVKWLRDHVPEDRVPWVAQELPKAEAVGLPVFWTFEGRLSRSVLLHPLQLFEWPGARFRLLCLQRKGQGKPETEDFLGFTHYCAKTRKRGCFIVGRKTRAVRMRAKLVLCASLFAVLL